MNRFVVKNIPSPCYVLDEQKLKNNLTILQDVQNQANISIICALKGYSFHHSFPLIKQYLKGATASSLHEAKLCMEYMGVKTHTYCPAYLPNDFDELVKLSSHITFNSLNEYNRLEHKVPKEVSIGLRLNPRHSESKIPLYDPCQPGSRFGVAIEELEDGLPERVEGIHIHNLCESDSYAFERTIAAVEFKFDHLIKKVKWVNFGGGHHITRNDYHVNHLVEILNSFKAKHPHLTEIILEPGEAIGLNAGYLITTVLDVIDSQGINVAIIDSSFTCHMPDCLEMPYTPDILNAEILNPNDYPKAEKISYRIGGISCLSGDQVGDYVFNKKLEVGDKIIFENMVIYTMVKTTTFNGVNLPSIGMLNCKGEFKLLRTFGYDSYKDRLG